jgi:PKD repeat protein
VWRFGDGTGRARGRRVTHTYARGGRYRVTSTVSEREGPRDVYIREVRALARR